jgi:hypothetical protein
VETLTAERRGAAHAAPKVNRRRERRPHRATVSGGLLVVVSHPLRFVVGNTQAWLSFATWLTDLAG